MISRAFRALEHEVGPLASRISGVPSPNSPDIELMNYSRKVSFVLFKSISTSLSPCFLLPVLALYHQFYPIGSLTERYPWSYTAQLCQVSSLSWHTQFVVWPNTIAWRVEDICPIRNTPASSTQFGQATEMYMHRSREPAWGFWPELHQVISDEANDHSYIPN